MSKLSVRTWLILAGAAALAACASLAAKRANMSDQEVIRFPHSTHAEAGVECATCHEAVAKSEELKGRIMPKEATCLDCHADWKEGGQCNQCHLTEKPQTWPERQRSVNFNHSFHVEGVEAKCELCHTKLPEPGETQRYTPSMQTCLGCHNHQEDYNAGRCQPCHTDLTRIALRPVSYFTHQGNYVRGHRLPARTEPETCAQCHEQSFCVDCHAQTVATNIEFKYPDRVDRQFIHRNDYVSRHQIEASADPAMCRRCHGTSFCQKCHSQNALTSQPMSGTNPRNPHPQGWVNPGSGTNFHGTAARRDINSCASCHDQGAASNCVACHRVGGIGGNPHPTSFIDQHKGDSRDNKTCRTCHL